jgi:hypothetical protein
MKKSIYAMMILIICATILSGCISPQETIPDASPAHTLLEEDPQWIPTTAPTISLAPTNSSASLPLNETDNSTWSYCDDRRPANILYERGCYGGGSSGGSNTPTYPVPEIRCFGMLAIGLIGIWYIAVRRT